MWSKLMLLQRLVLRLLLRISLDFIRNSEMSRFYIRHKDNLFLGWDLDMQYKLYWL